jgi:hypothetical protein
LYSFCLSCKRNAAHLCFLPLRSRVSQ